LKNKINRAKWRQLAQIVESEKPNSTVGFALQQLLLISLELNQRMEYLEGKVK